MSGLSPLAQEAQRKMDRDLRIKAAAPESYAVIKALREGTEPLDKLAAKIKAIYREVEDGA